MQTRSFLTEPSLGYGPSTIPSRLPMHLAPPSLHSRISPYHTRSSLPIVLGRRRRCNSLHPTQPVSTVFPVFRVHRLILILLLFIAPPPPPVNTQATPSIRRRPRSDARKVEKYACTGRIGFLATERPQDHESSHGTRKQQRRSPHPVAAPPTHKALRHNFRRWTTCEGMTWMGWRSRLVRASTVSRVPPRAQLRFQGASTGRGRNDNCDNHSNDTG